MKELKDIPGLKPEDVVVLKKYTYGDQSKLSAKITNVKMGNMKGSTSLENTEIDMWAAQIYPIVYGVAKAPFFAPGMSEEQKVQAIENLPKETGLFLLNAVKEYNEVGSPDDFQKK